MKRRTRAEAPPGRSSSRGIDVAAVGARLGDDLARARRRVQADAALERPRRGDGGAGDRPIGVGVEHDAVVRPQQIGRPDRVRAHGERRGLDHRPAAAAATRRGGQQQTVDGKPPANRGYASGLATRCRRGGRLRRFDRSGGSCYLLTHVWNRGAAPAGIVESGPACYQRIPPLANPFDMIKCGRCGNTNVRRRAILPVLWDPAGDEALSDADPSARVAAAPRGLQPLHRPHGRAPGPAAGQPMAAAVRVGRSSRSGFRLVVVHRDGTDGITYNLLGDQIDIGRTEGDLLFEDPHLAPRHARIVGQPDRAGC